MTFFSKDEILKQVERCIEKRGVIETASEFERWLHDNCKDSRDKPTFSSCVMCGQTPVINSRGVVIDRHDCKYVRKVNSLIPGAAGAADRSFDIYMRRIEGKTFSEEWSELDTWDAMYHRGMERHRSAAGVPLRRV